jgi:hypothetical protein
MTSSTDLRTRHIAQRRVFNGVSASPATKVELSPRLSVVHSFSAASDFARSALRRRMLSRLIRRRRSSICSVSWRLSLRACNAPRVCCSIMVPPRFIIEFRLEEVRPSLHSGFVTIPVRVNCSGALRSLPSASATSLLRAIYARANIHNTLFSLPQVPRRRYH